MALELVPQGLLSLVILLLKVARVVGMIMVLALVKLPVLLLPILLEVPPLLEVAQGVLMSLHQAVEAGGIGILLPALAVSLQLQHLLVALLLEGHLQAPALQAIIG